MHRKLLSAVLAVLAVLVSLSVSAATLPELFLKAKEQFKFGNYAQSLATVETLDAESAKAGLEQERQKLLPGLLFYKAASLAALGRSEEAEETFQAFLVYQPNARLDPSLYPRAVIAALEEARKTSSSRANAPEETGILATDYRAFRLPESKPLVEAGEEWADGPAKYLLTSEERKSFQNLADPLSRSEFISGFWKARDSKPETPENEFREEFEKRIAFSDARFTQDEVRGSLTDRGMVFILVGPPTYSGRRPLTLKDEAGAADVSGQSRYSRAEVESAYRTGSGAARAARIERVTGPDATMNRSAANWIEVWHYLRANLPKGIPYQELITQFVTKDGYGKNVLQRDATVLAALERAKQVLRSGDMIAGRTGS
jgi:GWxTD domain-containing protein